MFHIHNYFSYPQKPRKLLAWKAFEIQSLLVQMWQNGIRWGFASKKPVIPNLLGNQQGKTVDEKLLITDHEFFFFFTSYPPSCFCSYFFTAL